MVHFFCVVWHSQEKGLQALGESADDKIDLSRAHAQIECTMSLSPSLSLQGMPWYAFVRRSLLCCLLVTMQQRSNLPMEQKPTYILGVSWDGFRWDVHLGLIRKNAGKRTREWNAQVKWIKITHGWIEGVCDRSVLCVVHRKARMEGFDSMVFGHEHVHAWSLKKCMASRGQVPCWKTGARTRFHQANYAESRLCACLSLPSHQHRLRCSRMEKSEACKDQIAARNLQAVPQYWFFHLLFT